MDVSSPLDRVLATAIRWSGVRASAELHRSIADAFADLHGHGQAVLYLYADGAEAFVPRACAGCDGDFRGTPVSRQEFAAATDDGRRVLVPLRSQARETIGFVELTAPASGFGADDDHRQPLATLAALAAGAIDACEAQERLARINAELAQASDKLKTLGEMKNNFLANVSHELRTPLTSMLAYTEMIRRKGDALAATTRDDFLRIIAEEGEKLTGVIDDLLRLDSMQVGQARLERVRTDLVDLARRLAELWQAQAEERGVTLTVAASASAIELDVDVVLCQQVLQHLVGNALKFTPRGGHVWLELAEQGTAVRIEVSDDGAGIPPDQLQAIFERFYQVDDTATREHNGQGVGLAICRDIVAYHDGRIWAENLDPAGARFTVLLPRRPTVVIPAAPPPPTADFADPRLFLQRLLHWVAESVGVQLVSLMMPDAGGEHLEIRAALGLPETVVQTTRLRRGAGYAGRAWQTGRTLLLADMGSDPAARSLYTTTSLLIVPVIAAERVLGVIMVNNRLDGRPLDDDDRLLLESLAPRVAHLLERFDAHHAATREFVGIQESLRATTPVGRLRHTDAASLCRQIALAAGRRLGLSEADLRDLAFALQFYDAGLGCVPPHVLDKAGPLTPLERAQIEQHVHASLATLAPLAATVRVRQMILHHHERHDGGGYPGGLAGEAIPPGARLIALADRLRALLQSRPYRPGVPLPDALAELRAMVGMAYCPRVAAAFLDEAQARAAQAQSLRDHADDGEDLKRPAPAHPAGLVRS